MLLTFRNRTGYDSVADLLDWAMEDYAGNTYALTIEVDQGALVDTLAASDEDVVFDTLAEYMDAEFDAEVEGLD